MARVLLLKNQQFDKVYVNDKTVGPAGANVRDDVCLVQYFLRVAMEDAKDSPGFKPPNEQPIKIDGFFGGQTARYIKFFQEEVNRRRKGLLKADGNVDSPRTGTMTSSISKTFYTIGALNAAYRNRRGDSHDISSDPLYPQELDGSLFILWN
jgi:hypothetical protein